MLNRLRNWLRLGFRRRVEERLDRIERLQIEIVKMHAGQMTPEELRSVVDQVNRTASALEAASK